MTLEQILVFVAQVDMLSCLCNGVSFSTSSTKAVSYTFISIIGGVGHSCVFPSIDVGIYVVQYSKHASIQYPEHPATML